MILKLYSVSKSVTTYIAARSAEEAQSIFTQNLLEHDSDKWDWSEGQVEVVELDKAPQDFGNAYYDERILGKGADLRIVDGPTYEVSLEGRAYYLRRDIAQLQLTLGVVEAAAAGEPYDNPDEP